MDCIVHGVTKSQKHYRAVQCAVGRPLRREQPGAQQQRALAQRQRPRGRGAHDAQGVGYEPHARRGGRAPQGQVGWSLGSCASALPSQAPPGSAWDSPPPHRSVLECALPWGLCEHRKGPPLQPGKPLPGGDFFVWGEWGVAPWMRRRCWLGALAGCCTWPFKVLTGHVGEEETPQLLLCVRAERTCVFRGQHFSVHWLIDTHTSDSTNWFTPQFADEKLRWGLDERPVSDRPGFQPAGGPSGLLRPPEELDTADGRSALRPVCLTWSGPPHWVLSCRGSRG